MGFLELLNKNQIKVPIQANTKEALLKELIDLLDAEGCLKDSELAYTDILKREAMGSTGLERGIAIPHSKTAAVDDMCLAIGIAPNGIEYNSVDGKPATLIFMILAPPDMSGPHIEVLSDIAKFTQSDAICRVLKSSNSSEEVIEIFQD